RMQQRRICQRRKQGRGGSGVGVRSSSRHPHREKTGYRVAREICTVLVQILEFGYAFDTDALGVIMNRMGQLTVVLLFLLCLSSGPPGGAASVDLTVMTQNSR